MEIVVFGFRGCLGSAFVGAVDMLTLSRSMISKENEPPAFRVTTASSDGRPFEDGGGRRFEVDKSLDAIASCSAIIAPGYLCDGGNQLLSTPSIACRCRVDKTSTCAWRFGVRLLQWRISAWRGGSPRWATLHDNVVAAP